VIHLVTAPAVGGFAVEQELEARVLLFRRERVGRRVLGANRGGEQQERNSEHEWALHRG